MTRSTTSPQPRSWHFSKYHLWSASIFYDGPMATRCFLSRQFTFPAPCSMLSTRSPEISRRLSRVLSRKNLLAKVLKIFYPLFYFSPWNLRSRCRSYICDEPCLNPEHRLLGNLREIINDQNPEYAHIQDLIDHTFLVLCGEYPGAVVIRQSHDRLERLKFLDQNKILR